MRFSILLQTSSLKPLLFFVLLILTVAAKAQRVDSIFVHLYTDSLKKGTYNYINIDGKLTSGKFIPLDSSNIIFTSSDGKFSGNSLWINRDFAKEKVTIKAVLKSNPSLYKEFTMYIKKKPNDDNLKTLDEIMNEPNSAAPSRRKKH
jgi:hypothetical protein